MCIDSCEANSLLTTVIHVMNIEVYILLIFPSISYGIFNNGVKYVPMGYKEKASCPPNVPTKKQGGGNVTFL